VKHLRVLLISALLFAIPATAHADAITPTAPISHVVIIYQENHSFDNVLGAWCVQTARCDGATTAKVFNGTSTTTMPLLPASDVVPKIDHSDNSQIEAMDGGKMDRFQAIRGCHKANGYLCLEQYQPAQIPNLIALAQQFSVSDRTFEGHAMPSWGSHLDLVTANLDGFTGDNPGTSTTGATAGNGWGCDSNRDAAWMSPQNSIEYVPACVPDYNLNPTTYPFGGAYRQTPVSWEPTIMDEMKAAGLSWRIYETSTGGGTTIPYGWAICPTFADCIDTGQKTNVVASTNIIQAAQKGTLSNLSLVMPSAANSQHNAYSMATGDNWIGKVMTAVMNGPEWSSTAVFIAYDDCGCFYDHVAPPPGDGPRLPMVIASPYAKPGFTDSTTATPESMLAFVEHLFGLPAMSTIDASSYDYANSFSFPTALAMARLSRSANPRGVQMAHTSIPESERRYMAAHPAAPDDPT
jgi:phospholipase C